MLAKVSLRRPVECIRKGCEQCKITYADSQKCLNCGIIGLDRSELSCGEKCDLMVFVKICIKKFNLIDQKYNITVNKIKQMSFEEIDIKNSNIIWHKSYDAPSYDKSNKYIYDTCIKFLNLFLSIGSAKIVVAYLPIILKHGWIYYCDT